MSFQGWCWCTAILPFPLVLLLEGHFIFPTTKFVCLRVLFVKGNFPNVSPELGNGARRAQCGDGIKPSVWFMQTGVLLTGSYVERLEEGRMVTGILRRWRCQQHLDSTVLQLHAHMFTPFCILHSLSTWLKPSQSEMSCWFWAQSRNCFSSYWQAPLSC